MIKVINQWHNSLHMFPLLTSIFIIQYSIFDIPFLQSRIQLPWKRHYLPGLILGQPHKTLIARFRIKYSQNSILISRNISLKIIAQMGVGVNDSFLFRELEYRSQNNRSFCLLTSDFWLLPFKPVPPKWDTDKAPGWKKAGCPDGPICRHARAGYCRNPWPHGPV